MAVFNGFTSTLERMDKRRSEPPAGDRRTPSRRAGAGAPAGADRARGSRGTGKGRSGTAAEVPRSRSEADRPRVKPEAKESEPGFGPFSRDDGDWRERRPDATGVRKAAEGAVARGAAGSEKSSLRLVKRDPTERVDPRKLRGKGKAVKPARGGVPASGAVPAKVLGRVQDAVVSAAKALERGYERDAARILQPHREAHADLPDVRELLGLAYYRLGRWKDAQKELEAFARLTASSEQHPVLMDCARALGRHAKVATLWEELRGASPGPAIVVEGRIVAAGSLADQGKLAEAIALLERAQPSPKRIGDHHLRLWYALGDLQERAGDLPAARNLFRKVSAQDPAFVDVAERLAALS